MKKFLSLLMALVMLLSVGSVAAFAVPQTYEVVFTECPYDVAPYRSDYIGKYVGYNYGTDYWYTVTNADGTATDIKGFPYSVFVEAGKALEFTVSVADHIEPSSVRMLAYPTSLELSALYDDFTGEPDAQYYIAKSDADSYGVKPSEDITICLSEYHMFNDCFLYDFPKSEYYAASRLELVNPEAVNPQDMFADVEWDNTKVIYENETLFVKVSIPMDGKYDYHYETYQFYYTLGYGNQMKTVYLKQNASEKEGTEAVDLRYAHYETEDEWVDIYAIPDVDYTLEIKVVNTVTYTLSMLAEFFEDFSLENIDDIDFGSLDVAPLFEFFVRIINLIVKLLAGFGVELDLSSLFG